jgi:hypothetical protein
VGAVAVLGHEARGLGQVLEVLGPGRPILHRPQHAGEVGRAHGARRALAAGLPLEERREGRGDRERAHGATHDQERGGAEAGAGGSERIRVERCVQTVRRKRRRRGARGEEHPDALGRAAAGVFDDGPQGRAEGHLVGAGPSHVAPERDPGLLAVPERLRIRDRGGDPRQGLHVLHQRGPALETHGGGQGGFSRGHALRPSRVSRTAVLPRRSPPRPPDAHARPSGRIPQGRFQGRSGPGERALQIDDGLPRADGPGGHRQARHDVAGARDHHHAVLDGAGLPLGAVGHHEGLARLGPHRLPLPGDREPAPAPAPEPRRPHGIDQVLCHRKPDIIPVLHSAWELL